MQASYRQKLACKYFRLRDENCDGNGQAADVAQEDGGANKSKLNGSRFARLQKFRTMADILASFRTSTGWKIEE